METPPKPRRSLLLPLIPSMLAAASTFGALGPLRPRRAFRHCRGMPAGDPGANSPRVNGSRLPRPFLRSHMAEIPAFGFRGYPPGPCEICGKPNVRNGRESGIYRCRQHLEAAE